MRTVTVLSMSAAPEIIPSSEPSPEGSGGFHIIDRALGAGARLEGSSCAASSAPPCSLPQLKAQSGLHRVHPVVRADGAAVGEIHAERALTQLNPILDLDCQGLSWTKQWFWDLYRELGAYREAPSQDKQDQIKAHFEQLVTLETSYAPLNAVLGRFSEQREDLLRVLDHPEVPLHNNLSENDIREQVTRRKVSGGTRSEAGRRCRDTFLSLKKTCRKHGISFWAFLKDRITGAGEVPPLADIIRRAAQGAQPVPAEAVTCGD